MQTRVQKKKDEPTSLNVSSNMHLLGKINKVGAARNCDKQQGYIDDQNKNKINEGTAIFRKSKRDQIMEEWGIKNVQVAKALMKRKERMALAGRVKKNKRQLKRLF
uniref:Uncharacterized protein n=1 Tax=Corethron hystrix TaxID=216773 RepID=A0A7S1FNT2_9STRA|mmetsp:Transcript_16919/g.38068  ORF Transcript_16919/g.38068 Transcript_16919/m.38068 type:complete len:106 (+) Transcript_16919:697-1014(+)